LVEQKAGWDTSKLSLEGVFLTGFSLPLVAAHSLCVLPSYIYRQPTASLWDATEHVSVAEALSEGSSFKGAYFKDVDYVFGRCHHHWHPKDKHSGKRLPIRGCRSKKTGLCKGGFPLKKRCTLLPKVICKG